MTTGQAIVYGVLQGLTEYLPISSTAHIRIVPALLGWDDPGAAFTAVIQIGTLMAVLAYFSRDVVNIIRATVLGLVHGKPFESLDARMGWMIAVGTVPVVLCGLLFKQEIETSLRSLYVISASLIILALVLLYAEDLLKRKVKAGLPLKNMNDLSWKDAIWVGLVQAVALIPGASRSGVTITGGLLLGMTRVTAARFSFLLSLPSIFAAGVYELLHHWESLLGTQEDTRNIVVATVVSGVVGYLSIAFLLNYLKKHTTLLFIVYRLLLGGMLLALLFNEKLAPI